MEREQSFVEAVTAGLPTSWPMEWPFAVPGGGPRPKVLVHILGAPAIEAAHVATLRHFRSRGKQGKVKVRVAPGSPAFNAHENLVEIVYRAFSTEQGKPLDDTVELFAERLTDDQREVLYFNWKLRQVTRAVPAPTQAEVDALVEHLKKNIHSALLDELAWSSLLSCIRTMAAQLASSTTPPSGTSPP